MEIMISRFTRNPKIGLALRSTLSRERIQREYCLGQTVHLSQSSLNKSQFARKYTRKSNSDRQDHQCVLYQVKEMRSFEN